MLNENKIFITIGEVPYRSKQIRSEDALTFSVEREENILTQFWFLLIENKELHAYF